MNLYMLRTFEHIENIINLFCEKPRNQKRETYSLVAKNYAKERQNIWNNKTANAKTVIQLVAICKCNSRTEANNRGVVYRLINVFNEVVLCVLQKLGYSQTLWEPYRRCADTFSTQCHLRHNFLTANPITILYFLFLKNLKRIHFYKDSP